MRALFLSALLLLCGGDAVAQNLLTTQDYAARMDSLRIPTRAALRVYEDAPDYKQSVHNPMDFQGGTTLGAGASDSLGVWAAIDFAHKTFYFQTNILIGASDSITVEIRGHTTADFSAPFHLKTYQIKRAPRQGSGAAYRSYAIDISDCPAFDFYSARVTNNSAVALQGSKGGWYGRP